MDIDQIKALLEKYKLGTSSEEETKLIEGWLAEIKIDHRKFYDDDFIQAQLNITKGKIDTIIGTQPTIRRKKQINVMAIAAAILILISATIAIWALNLKSSAASQLASQSGVKQHITNGWVYIQTPKGLTDRVKLPDGSLVTLDASSTLRYPTKFINHKRPVYLDEGEALFEVAKDKTSPFTVYTNKFATTALGTAFNIRSYANEHKVSISLIHGKIRVDDLHPGKKTKITNILLPHQQIVLNKLSGKLIQADFTDETPITSWKDGVLSFSNASADEVINAISNRFNVTIINKSDHTNWSYTGNFRNETLIDVLKTVCLTEGIACSINQDNITLN